MKFSNEQIFARHFTTFNFRGGGGGGGGERMRAAGRTGTL